MSETVLVVEDDDAVRSSVRRVLARAGYDILEAGHPHDALRISDEHTGPIDLVVTDLTMPELGGRELVDRIRERRPEVRVLFMSGYTEQAMGDATLDRATGFIEKPFMIDAFLLRVRELLGSHP